MKTWQTISILALSVAIAAWGWLTTFRTKAPESEKAASIVSRKPTSAGRTEQAIKPAPFNLARQSEEFSFNDAADKGMNLSFGDDFGFEDEIKEKLSTVLQEIYDQYLAASNREDRKAMLAAIQRLLAKSASGEKLPIWLKQQMIEGIKWVGSSAMPEVIEMAADADVDISSSALDALQDLLWDFDTTPQQIADALKQVVRLSTDTSVIEPFICEMDTMPLNMRVSAALSVFDSGNATAVECLQNNMDFVFENFDGSIKTREDVVRYGAEHAADDSAGTVDGK